MHTIGILGGMGPAAGVKLYQWIIEATEAQRDQDHPRCFLYGATHIPDRSAHMLGEGEDPTPHLVAAVRVLESVGADFIAIPCNSAHAYLAEMRAAVGIPILDMIEIAAAAVGRVAPGAEAVGLLATSGTIVTGLYQGPLRDAGYGVLEPEPEVQARVMEAIRSVKAGSSGSDERLESAVAHLVERGADAVVLGCTEIPLGLDSRRCSVPCVDSIRALADAALAIALRAPMPAASGRGHRPAGPEEDEG